MGLLCDMQLDNPAGIYNPGDTISGRITLHLDERVLLKAILLKTAGYATTYWEAPQKPKKEKKEQQNKEEHDEKKKSGKEKPKKAFANRDDLLATTNYFIGSDSAMAKIIDAGVYHYTFAVRLPDNSLSSCETTYGQIRYEMNVVIDYPDHSHTCYSRNLHVIRPLDLRTIAGMGQAHYVERNEKKCCGKFWQHPMQLQFNLPQLGYVCGEGISVHVKVINYDQLTLTDIIYKLNMVCTYTGYYKKKAEMRIERTILASSEQSLFGQNGSMAQHLYTLFIPQTPPTLNLIDCRCMQISYEVEVTVKSSKKKRTLSAVLPITVGTISLKDGNVHIMPREVSASTPALTVARSMDNLDLAPIEEMQAFGAASAPLTTPDASMNSLEPSSSFREADFMTPANLNTDKHSKSTDQLNFKPKYLYYEMNNQVLQELQNLQDQQAGAFRNQQNNDNNQQFKQ